MVPSDLKVMIKDVLRGARFVVRRSTSSRFLPRVPKPFDLISLGDKVATRAEDTLTRLRGGGGTPEERIALALDAYAGLAEGASDDAFEETFRTAHYVLAKHAFALRGVANAYLAEHVFAEAARALRAAGPLPRGTAFCAAAAVIVADAEPVRLIDPTGPGADDPFVRSANAAVAAAVGLATAAYLAKNRAPAPTECLASAADLVAPLHDRLAAALRSPAPAAEMAAVFDVWSPHVP